MKSTKINLTSQTTDFSNLKSSINLPAEKPNILNECPTESIVRSSPELSTPNFTISLETGSCLEVTNFLSLDELRIGDHKEGPDTYVPAELMTPRLCTNSPLEKQTSNESGHLEEVPDEPIAFTVNLLTQNYSVQETSSCECIHSNCQGTVRTDSKSSNEKRNLVKTFCLECVIFNETIK